MKVKKVKEILCTISPNQDLLRKCNFDALPVAY